MEVDRSYWINSMVSHTVNAKSDITEMTYATKPWRAMVLTPKNRLGIFSAEPVCDTAENLDFAVSVSKC